MQYFYYVSTVKLHRNQTVKPYGCEHSFKSMFDFCSAMIDQFPDKIPFISILDDFMKVKGVMFTNPCHLGSLMREVLVEQVRRSDYPDKPSRIGSTFVFNQYMDAYKFLFEYRGANGWIYQCQSPATQTFTGDMNIVTNAKLGHSDIASGYQSFKNEMKRYWEAVDHLQYPETICWDPVTIVEAANLGYIYEPSTGKFRNSTHVPLDPISHQPMLPYPSTLLSPNFELGTPFFRNGEWIYE